MRSIFVTRPYTNLKTQSIFSDYSCPKKILSGSIERILQKFNSDRYSAWKPLSPNNLSAAGTSILSERQRERLNLAANNKTECMFIGTLFRVGKRVLQTRNNCDKNVYYEDIGFTREHDAIYQALSVNNAGARRNTIGARRTN